MGAVLGAAAFLLGATTLGASAQAQPVPHYDHIFLLIEENHGYGQIIGNKAAPNLNALAQQYGLATRYYSIADPSLPNYIAMLGGDYFGIADDNPFWTHKLRQPSLMSQLDAAGLEWRGYYQGLPYAGYRGFCYPGRCNGVPDFDPLYSGKHNGVPYFESVQNNPAERRKMLPFAALAADLKNPPAFGYIVPDQCHDMHGSPPWCGDSGNPGDINDNQLVSTGDAFVAATVNEITTAPFWSNGTNAIVVTFDEGNGTAGCCDADPGTGRVVTIVITSRGPRALQDKTPYNHYSLLQTIQMAFGLGCLRYTCDTANVTPMAKLFAVQP